MLLAVEMTTSASIDNDGITYLVTLGKMKGMDEFHLYVDGDRRIITKDDYDKCISNKNTLKDFALELIQNIK